MATFVRSSVNRAGFQHDTGVFAVALILLIVALRLPFFFESVISVDESTYILMGQNLLDGNLPYLTLWDNKPPLLSAVYAASIAVFGHTIEGVRLAGCLFIVVAALGIYVGCRKFVGIGAAAVAAIVAAVCEVTIRAGQATMSEHLAIAPVCLAWALLSACGFSRIVAIAAGVLLGVATCMRTNLAYVAMLVALAMVFRPGGGVLRARVLDAVAFGTGAAIVVVACLLPFIVTGQLDLLLRSVILAPLEHSTSRKSTFEAIIGLMRVLRKPDQIFTLVVTILAALGALRIAISTASDKRHLQSGYWLLIFLAAVSWSVLATGASHPHYLIQVLPFCAVACAYALTMGDPRFRYARFAGIAALVYGAIVSLAPIATEYEALLSRISNHQPVAAGRAQEVADLLLRENPRKRGVYLMEDHIAYWLMFTKPLTRMSTHPSNISKPRVIALIEGPQETPLSELQRVFRQNPAFVVKSARPYYLKGLPAEHAWVEAQLKSRYEVIARIKGLEIHKLKSTSAAAPSERSGDWSLAQGAT